MTVEAHFYCEACGTTYAPDEPSACKCSRSASPDPWDLCQANEWHETTDEYRRSKNRRRTTR